MDMGHWEYPREFNIEDWVGFIYRIIDNETGMQYIGKKFFFSTRRKIVKGRKNRKRVIKESDWKSYCSSSKWLKEEIEKRGKEQFTFLIESLHESKASLHYREVELQIVEDVLRATLPDGTPAYYNGMIANMKFKLKPETELEKKYSISRIQKKRLPNKRALTEGWESKYKF
jgi:hypothetical protein